MEIRKRKTFLYVLIVLAVVLFYSNVDASVVDSVLPDKEASAKAGNYIVTLLGGVAILIVGYALTSIAKGFTSGIIVKSWNMLAEQTTSIRHFTGTGYYDSPVTSIGSFAVWTSSIDKDGVLVHDRIPYSLLISNRATIVSRKGEAR